MSDPKNNYFSSIQERLERVARVGLEQTGILGGDKPKEDSNEDANLDDQAKLRNLEIRFVNLARAFKASKSKQDQLEKIIIDNTELEELKTPAQFQELDRILKLTRQSFDSDKEIKKLILQINEMKQAHEKEMSTNEEMYLTLQSKLINREEEINRLKHRLSKVESVTPEGSHTPPINGMASKPLNLTTAFDGLGNDLISFPVESSENDRKLQLDIDSDNVLKDKIKDLETENKKLNEKIGHMESEKRKLEFTTKEMQSQVTSLVEEMAEMTDESLKLREQIKQLTSSKPSSDENSSATVEQVRLESRETIASLEFRLQQLQQKFNAVDENYSVIQSDLILKTKAVDEQKAKIELLETEKLNIQKELQTYNEKYTAEVKAHNAFREESESKRALLVQNVRDLEVNVTRLQAAVQKKTKDFNLLKDQYKECSDRLAQKEEELKKMISENDTNGYKMADIESLKKDYDLTLSQKFAENQELAAEIKNLNMKVSNLAPLESKTNNLQNQLEVAQSMVSALQSTQFLKDIAKLEELITRLDKMNQAELFGLIKDLEEKSMSSIAENMKLNQIMATFMVVSVDQALHIEHLTNTVNGTVIGKNIENAVSKSGHNMVNSVSEETSKLTDTIAKSAAVFNQWQEEVNEIRLEIINCIHSLQKDLISKKETKDISAPEENVVALKDQISLLQKEVDELKEKLESSKAKSLKDQKVGSEFELEVDRISSTSVVEQPKAEDQKIKFTSAGDFENEMAELKKKLVDEQERKTKSILLLRNSKNKITKLESDLKDREDRVLVLQKELESTVKLLQQRDSLLQQEQNTITVLKKQNEETLSRLSDAQNLAKQLEPLKSELKTEKQRVIDLEESLKANQKQFSVEINETIAKLEKDHESRVKHLKDEVERMGQEIEYLRMNIQKVDTGANELQASLAEAKLALEGKISENDQLKIALSEIEVKIFEKEQEVIRLMEEKGILQKEFKARLTSFKENKTLNENLKQEVNVLNEKLKMASEIETTLQNQLEQLQFSLDAKQKDDVTYSQRLTANDSKVTQDRIEKLEAEIDQLTSAKKRLELAQDELKSDFRMKEIQLKNINKALKDEVRKFTRSSSASSSNSNSPSMSRSGSTDKTNLASLALQTQQLALPEPEYLKNVILKLLISTVKSQKLQLVAVIGMILKFSPEELKQAQTILRVLFSIFNLKWIVGRIHAQLSHYFASPEELSGIQNPPHISSKFLTINSTEAFADYWGYSCQTHYVMTKDGYILTLHRIPNAKNEVKHAQSPSKHRSPHSKPVVLLWHGCMMSSEVWVASSTINESLAFTLAEAGYDVWLGNTRGNKYSCKHKSLKPHDEEFWDFSLDQFAAFDLPDSVEYILRVSGAKSLAYIGFSQGTGMGFSSLALNDDLNERINLFVALSPVTVPLGLENKTIHSFVHASPELIFLLFGRRAMLSSVYFWQSMLTSRTFAWAIDTSMHFLFNWDSKYMSSKNTIYRHLYSSTSVKCIVHWFQIMRSGVFQMYEDSPSVIPGAQNSGYRVPSFPTRQIKTPIALFHGGSDTIPDMKYILKNIPPPVGCLEVREYEHLQFLWGMGQDKVVFPAILGLLHIYNQTTAGTIRTVPWISTDDIKNLLGKAQAINRDPNTNEIIGIGGSVSVAEALKL